jgi:hypothetical protein
MYWRFQLIAAQTIAGKGQTEKDQLGCSTADQPPKAEISTGRLAKPVPVVYTEGLPGPICPSPPFLFRDNVAQDFDIENNLSHAPR